MLKGIIGRKTVYIVTGYTDMRKGIDGLAAIVQGKLNLDPYSKALFLFCGRNPRRMKGLLWEGDGFLLLSKRLENGKYRWPRNEYEALEDADVMARDVRVEDGMTKFSVVTKEGVNFGEYKMQLFGEHNVMNALSAVVTCLQLNIELKVIKEGLEKFQGVARRFDIRVRNEKVCYIDDYAHHPEEIKATLKAVKTMFPEKKLTLVFQPHLFSRTHDFMDEFAEVLSLADQLLLMEIYPAREKPMPGVTSSVLLEKISCEEKQICQKDELIKTIQNIEPELLVTMGAGDIDRFVPQLEILLKS